MAHLEIILGFLQFMYPLLIILPTLGRSLPIPLQKLDTLSPLIVVDGLLLLLWLAFLVVYLLC